MAIEAILGGVLGGLTRLAPEVLTFFTRKEELKDKQREREHELKLGDQQYKVLELQTQTQLAVKDLDVEQTQFASGMAALQTAIEAQAKPSGVKWVDAFAALIRPSVTVWVFVLYSMVKAAALAVALEANDLATSVLSLWTPNDEAMLSSILMFWFVGRVWDRIQPRVLPR